jgi:hypothetical protein
MIKVTIDVRLFDRAGASLKYIQLVHSILAAASGSWTITPIIPYLIYFYCTDKGRECMSRDASMYDPPLTPHNPNMGKVYDDYMYYMGNPTGFNVVLNVIKDWNRDMEHNNGYRFDYVIQHTHDYCSAIIMN